MGFALGHTFGVRVQRVQKVQKVQRVQRGRLTALRAEGCGIALSGDEFYNAAFGGHVHIKYHNQDYHRPSLRHFVALFP